MSEHSQNFFIHPSRYLTLTLTAGAPSAGGCDANVTYAWTDAGGSQHQLSLAFQSGPGGYFVHTEWYVPGFEATTLGVMIGPDFALSVIYAAGDSPPLPCPPKE